MRNPKAKSCNERAALDAAVSLAFVIKAEVSDSAAATFTFTAQKTMYGGKHIAEGDAVFVFAMTKGEPQMSSSLF